MTANPPADVGPISDKDLHMLRVGLSAFIAAQPNNSDLRRAATMIEPCIARIEADKARLQAAEARAARAEDALAHICGRKGGPMHAEPSVYAAMLLDFPELPALTREAPERKEGE